MLSHNKHVWGEVWIRVEGKIASRYKQMLALTSLKVGSETRLMFRKNAMKMFDVTYFAMSFLLVDTSIEVKHLVIGFKTSSSWSDGSLFFKSAFSFIDDMWAKRTRSRISVVFVKLSKAGTDRALLRARLRAKNWKINFDFK